MICLIFLQAGMLTVSDIMALTVLVFNYETRYSVLLYSRHRLSEMIVGGDFLSPPFPFSSLPLFTPPSLPSLPLPVPFLIHLFHFSLPSCRSDSHSLVLSLPLKSI